VAYNPNQELYYSINAGSGTYPLETYSKNGGTALSSVSSTGDYRGYWWNPYTGMPEGNTISGNITSNSLTTAFYGSTVTTNVTSSMGSPNAQYPGTADVDGNIVYYLSGNTIFRYSRLSGAFTSSVNLSGMPVLSLARNTSAIAYTGISGAELIVYDYILKEVYFINANSGAYVATCSLPALSAPAVSGYGFAFCNNRVFLYDSGNNRWIGYPITNPACSGQALSFNGGQYLAKASHSFGNNFTAEMWIRPTTVSGGWHVPFGQAHWNNNQGFVFRINVNNVAVEGPGGLIIEAPIVANAWTHLAFTYDNGICTFYKDGKIAGSQYKVIANASTSLMIGSRVGNAGTGVGDAYYGLIDEVRIWNTTRTGCQIQSFMNAEITGTATGLEANYHFNQGTGSGTNTLVTRMWDASSNLNTFNLNGFALTGSTTNWILNGAIATGFTTTTIPSAEINITGNSNNIIDGDLTPSSTDFTDFGNVLTRTFVISNTTSGTLSIGTPIITGTASANFSITTLPASTLAASATTSFVITALVSSGTYSGVVNIVNTDCSEPVYNFGILYNNIAGEALNFDGTNDFVSVAHTSSLNAFPLTVESWVKTTYTSTLNIAGIVGKYVTSSLNGWLLYNYGGFPYALYFANASNSVGFPITSSVNIADNNWHHVALVVDASGGRIFVDGVQAGPLTPWIGTPGSPNTTQPINIGAYDAYFPGTIDEVRIWNVARSQCEIQQYMKAEIPTTAAGLMANYHFNQGIAGSANSTVTTLTDAAGVNTGTVLNFGLTSSSSNWVAPGGVVSGSTTAASVNATLTVKGNGNNIPVGAVTTLTNNTDFGTATTKSYLLGNIGTGTLYINSVSFIGGSASRFSLSPAPSNSLASAATTTFNIIFTPTVVGTASTVVSINTNDCTNPNYTFVITANTQTGSCLTLDGTNDQVLMGTNASLDVLNAPFTMEAWVYPTTTKYNTIISKGDGNGIANNGEYIFQVSNSNYLSLYNTSVNGWKYSTTTVPLNQWSHVAAVFDGKNTYFYINGVISGFSASSTNTANSSGYNFYVGRQGQNCNCNFFQGKLDEVRVWKTARTQCQIQQFMNCEIPTTATDLVANYHFNTGIPSGTNSTYTLLTDAVGVNTGTLSGFTLSGSSSNWTSPAQIANGFTTSTANGVSLTITGNGNNVPTGAVTSTANFTDFNGVATRSFVLSNTGTGTVMITTGYITGPNAAQFSVTTIPSTAITTGTTALAITLTPTSTGVYTATLNIISNDCSAPNYSFVITSSVSAASALALDGSNDYIQLADPNFGTSDFTMEAWIKPSTNNDGHILTTRTSEGGPAGTWWTLHAGYSIQLELASGAGNYSVIATPTTIITPGNWYHVAAVRTNSIIRVYVNGDLQAIATETVTRNLNTGNNSLRIGGWPNYSSGYYNGVVDEVRLWNVARTHCQIQQFMKCEITSTASGLIGNYHFNQGMPGYPNTGTSFLINSAVVNSGTLIGFALTGTNSNWVSPGGVISGSITPSSLSPTLVINGNGNNVPTGTTVSTANFTDFNGALTRSFVISNVGTTTLQLNTAYFTGPNAAQFSITTVPSTAIASGTTALGITLTPTLLGTHTATLNILSNDCANPNYSFVISASSGTGSSFAFDGSNDYVNLGTSASFKPTSALTAEAWAYRPNWSTFTNTEVIIANTESAGYGIHFRSGAGDVAGYLRRNGSYAEVTYPLSSLTPGWHHFALTYDGRYTRLIIDGELRDMNNAGATYTIDYNSANSTIIGADASSGTVAVNSYFQGAIDEVRIWNYARTHCQIQQFMSCEITSTASGLVGNFHFNQGIPNGPNSTYSVLTNATGATNGTLTNAALTGTNSNWTNNAGVVSGYTVVGAQNASLAISGNGNNVPVGVTTSTANNTDFNAALTRSFVLSNAGTGTVQISTGYFTGPNANQFSVTTIPSTAITTGTTGMVITLTPTATGVYSATLNIISNDCANPNYSFAVTCNIPSPSSVCVTPTWGYGISTNPIGVALGYYNADNNLDASLVFEGSSSVRILIGSVNGTLNVGTSYTVGTSPGPVVNTDLNGDTYPDIIVGNKGSDNISVLLGTGTATFTGPTNISVGSTPRGLAAVDLNADGKVDVITANGGSGNVSVLLGNGSGGFASAVNYTAGSGPSGVVAKDFNQDGKIDLAVTNFSSNNVSILYGTGGGAFGAAVNYTVGAGPSALASSDFNNDGKLDLVVVSETANSISLFLGTGSSFNVSTSTYTNLNGPSAVECADLNYDGEVDVIVANRNTSNYTMFYGSGTGLFNMVNQVVISGSRGFAVGDLNSDAKPDIAATSYVGTNLAVVLNGIGLITSFTPTAVCPGNSVTLGATNGVSYTWNPGGINTASTVVNPTATTVYTVTASNGLGCTSTAIRTLVVLPQNAMSVTGAGNLIAAGSTTTTTLNLTNWNGATTQTYVINNTTGSISINSIFDSGPNSAQFFISTAPATSLGIGSTSFVVSLTPTATGVYSGTITIQTNDCANPTYSFVITSSISPASALSFDGTNDNVAVNTNSLINFGTGDFSVEAFIKTSTAHSNFTGIVVKASSSSGQGFQLGIQNGKLVAEIGSSTTSLTTANGLVGVTTISNNAWHHLAMVVNRSQSSVKLYVDGVLDAVVTHTAIAGMDVSSTSNMFIGRARSGSIYFNGWIDEVRLWNVARTQCEIQTYMGAEITTTASGLVSNFHFNQGTPSGANSALTNLTESANGLANSFLNFALTGTISNFVSPGAVVNGYTTTTAPTATISVTGNGANVPQGVSTATANFTDFGGNTSRTFSITNLGSGTLNINNILFSGAGASQFSVTVLPTSAITTGTTGFQISYLPTVAGQVTAVVNITSNDCANPNYSFVITASASPASALSFDGVNDYVSTNNTLTASYTKEAWVNINNSSSSNNIISGGTTTSGHALWAPSSSGYKLLSGHNGTWNYVQDPTALSFNTWYHVAVTYDATNNTMKLYKNGVLVSYNTSVPTFSGSNVTLLGSIANSFLLGGSLDEVRIWNTVRTQCEIQQFMNCEITTTVSGLVANYHFNQGIPSGTNTTVTSLVDATGAFTGTLNGFALTGTTSNWVSPGGVVNDYTVTTAPQATIAISGNGNNVPMGTGTSTNNNTDFGTNTSRIFTVGNTGTGSLNVGPIVFTGANAAQFSISASPASSIAASGSSTFSILFTPTAVGISSAVVNISSNDCVNPTYSFVITASASPASALTLDGVNDYVAVTSSTAIPSGNSPYTIEAWIKTTTSANMGIVAWGNYGTTNQCNAFRLGSGGTIVNYWWANDLIVSAPSLTNGAWHHVAATYDGVTRSIYADGVLLASDTPTGLAVATTSNITIGTSNNYSEFFNGSIDEVRIWNVARSQCDLQQYMNCEITSTASGLVFNSHFNQGLPSGSNTAVTTLSNSAASNNGVLINFALTGASSNWTSPGGVVSGSITPAVISSTIAVSGNGNNVPIGSSTTTLNLTHFGSSTTNSFVISNLGSGTLNIGNVSLSAASGAIFSVTTLPSTAITTGTTAFAITFTPTAAGICSAVVKIASNDCTSPNYSFVITGSTSPAAALSLDGANDHIALTNSLSSWNIGNNFTIESWIKPNNVSTSQLLLYTGYGCIDCPAWALSIGPESTCAFSGGNAGRVVFMATNKTSTNAVVQSQASPSLGVWTHVAVTGDGSTLRMYINGVLQSTAALTFTIPSSTYRNIGADPSTTGGCNVRYAFNGHMDELRFWNVARTQCEIQSYMNAEITTTASGLTANYHFNQGIPAGANATQSVVIDAVAATNNGTLTSMALTGTTSNWVNPGGVTSGFTTVTAPGATIAVSGNGNNIPIGVSTSTNNFTDFGTNSSRQLSISNTGTTTLNVGTIIFTGANAAQFSVSASPASSIAASGSSTFSVLFTPTAVGISSAVVNISSNDCANPNYSFVITANVVPPSSICISPVANYSTNANPRAVASSDFNNDGKLDLAVTNELSNNVTVLFGNGYGNYTVSANYTVGSNPYPVVASDFNNDGKVDLAIGNALSNSISLLLGSSSGTFSSAGSYATGTNPQSLVNADFNSDGYQDLVCTNYGSGNISVLLGTSSGSFNAAVNYTTGSGALYVTAADFNGDSKLDLAVANYNANNVTILLGQGNGAFTFGNNFSVGSGPICITHGDYNNDGQLDLATSNENSNNVSLLRGVGTGSFFAAINFTAGSNPRGIITDDFNGDGLADLAVSSLNNSNVSLYLGTGLGVFGSPVNYSTGLRPVALISKDFNGDGKKDIAAASYSSNAVSILINGAALVLNASSSTICSGYSTTLTANGGTTYLWSPGGSTSSSINVNPTSSSIYSLSGTNSIGCTGLATINIVVVPTSSLIVSGNGNNIPIGVSTTTLNNTDFLNSTSRTFSLSNSGSGTININSISFTGANAAQFSVSASPASSIAASGSSTFSILFTPTAVGISSAVVNISSNDCANSTYSFVITASATPADALNFDGINDHVRIGTPIAQNSSYTKECWVYARSASSNNIISSSSSPFWLAGNKLSAINNGGATISEVGSFQLNQWVHVAVTFNAVTNVLTLYKNGVAVATGTGSGYPNGEFVAIGQYGYGGNNFFDGLIDEVRIWNVARTPCEIQTYMNAEITTTLSGLVANYHFNQGLPSGSNTAVTSLVDAAGAYTGTLTGLALTGTVSNWVSPGAITSGFTTTTAPNVTLAISGNGNAVPIGATTSTLNFTDFETNTLRVFTATNSGTNALHFGSINFTGANAAQFSVNAMPASSIAASGSSTFSILFTPTAVGISSAVVNIISNDCANPNYSFVITASASPASALSFNGNQVVQTGIDADTDVMPNTTWEAWIYPTTTAAGYRIIAAIDDGGWDRFITLNGNQIRIATANSSEATVTTYSANQWYHLAVVYQQSLNVAYVYVNGIQYGPYTTAFSGSGMSVNNFMIGANINYQNYFVGKIDEVRVWSTARTQCEIQTFMNCEIPTTATGLVGNFHFNQGVPSSTNTSVTSATNAAAANSGTLIGFALTGTTSNWVSPGAIVNGYTTTNAPTASFSLTGNGNNIGFGATATSTLNNTDFGTNASRTFSIYNAGSGTLNISSIFFTGTNATQFSVTTPPAGALTSGGSSFVITLTPTNTGISTATVNIPSNDCTNPTFSFVITASTSPASAFKFDGFNDYVAVAHNNTLNTLPFTVETWFKTGLSASGAYGLVSKYASGLFNGWNLYYASGTVSGYYFGNSSNYVNWPITSTVTISDNNWHHAAMVVDVNGATIYIDGVRAGPTSTWVGTPTAASNTLNVQIANYSNNYHQVEIDEVRLWNTARTQCDLQTYMSAEITSTASGLMANYHFNQGVPSGPNTSVTNVLDATGNNNGTLIAVALTGTTSNWISPGGIANGYTITSPPQVTLVVSGNGNNVPVGTNTSTNNFTDFNTNNQRVFAATNSGTNTLYINSINFTGANAAQFSVNAMPTGSIAASGSSTFSILFTPTAVGISSAVVNIKSNDCANPNYSFVISASVTAAEALRFNGSNSVTVANSSTINFGTGDLTIEAHIKTANTFANFTGIACKSSNVNVSGYQLAMLNNKVAAELGDGTTAIGTAQGLLGATAINDNQWHHIAMVVNRAQNSIRLYVDGILDASYTNTVVSTLNVTNSFNLLIGAERTSNFLFNGTIDDVRLWNVARTQCELQQYMKCEITSTASGLVANYHFNQGIPSGSNSAVTTLTDAVGANNGTLTGFVLTGSVSNWVNPGAVISGSTTPAVVNATINLSANGNAIPTGTTTSTSNNTDFGTNSSRSFTISNTGSGVLNIGNIYFTGTNAAQFSVTSLPSSSLSGVASTSFIITLTPTNTGINTATVNIPSNDCSTPIYTFVITASVSPASAIALDGTNDNLRAPLFSTNTNSVTMEAWVNWSGTNGNTQVIMHNGNTGGNGYGLFLPANSSVVNLLIGGIYTGSLNYTLTPNVWTKLSLSIENGQYVLYANGVARFAATINTPATPSGSFCIGGNLSNAQTFFGKIDEVRFWDRVLSPCEIQTYLSAEITTTATGLSANYHFNQGIPNGINTAVTSCTDAAGSNHLNLFNLALTGTVSNWVTPGAVANGFNSPSTITAIASISGNGNTIASGNFTPQTTNFTDFGTASSRTFVVTNTGTTALNIVKVSMSGVNASEFTVTSVAPTTVAATASINITVAFSPTATGIRQATVDLYSNDCATPKYSFAVKGSAPIADALYFDGANDFAARSAAVTTATNNITIQAKVKLTGGTGYHQFIATNGSYALMMNVGGLFCAYVPPLGIITSSYALQTNTWVALSMVLGNGVVNMYADGVFVGSSNLNSVSAPSGSFVIGANVSGGEMFKGVIDEVLVWNKALTHCEIQTYLNTEIATTASSLTANYHFNQGSPNLNNTGVNILNDDAGSNYTLSLNNFALTGTVSNWVSPGGVMQGNTVTTAPTATLLVTGNGNTITTGATTTSTLNLTDFGGLCLNTTTTSKTYSLFNNGTSSLQITNIRLSSASTPFTVTATPAIYNASTGGTFAVAMSPTAIGSYSNTVIVETNDCNNPLYTFVISSTVNALPSISVVASSTQVCSNSTVSLSGSGADTYTWSAGISNGTAFSPTATTAYTVAGTSTLTGCTNTAVQTVSILALPNIIAGGNPTICIGGSGSASVTGGATYTWTGIGTGSMQIVSPTVTTVYTVTGTDANGCSNVAYHTMTVNLHPTITVSSGSICTNNIFTITPTGAGVGGTYTIPFGSFTVSGNDFLVSPTASTFFIVIGTATTGCSSQGTMNGVAQITVNPIPTLAVNSTSICTGNNAIITPSGAATYTISGGSFTVSPFTTTAYTVTGTSSAGCTATLPVVSQVTVFNTPTISVNSGSVCDGQSFTISPTGANSYTITGNNFTVTPSSTTAYSVTGTSTNGCVSTVAVVSSVSVFPNPTITASSGSICEGQSFTITPSGAANYTYSSGNAVVSPTVTTSYSVTGTSSVGCAAQVPAQVNVTVNLVPVISVNSASICSGQSIVITPTGASTYSITGNNFTVTPLTSTNYSVSGTSSAGCVSTVQAVSQITVQASPTIAVNSGSICEGSTFAIVPTGATAYTITGGNFTVSPLVTTAYSVSGSFSYGCISNMVVSNVTVDPTPTITAASGSICAGDVFTISPSGAFSYTYTSGSNTVNPAVTTAYSVTGTSSAGCVSQTAAVVNVTVNAVPVLTVNSGTICEGGTFVIVPSGANTYTVSGNNFTVTPLTTTSYSVSGTSLEGCISAVQAVAQVSVLANPTLAVTSATLCNGETFTIVPSGADTYTITGGSMVVTPSVSTDYTITGSYNYGCDAVNPAIASITVYALPVVTITNAAICINDSYTLNPSGAVSYTYLPAGPVVNPTTTTNYTITGSSAEGCISASGTTVDLIVNPLPTITVVSGSICIGSSFTLSPDGANTYTFTPDGPTVTPTITSQYSVVGTSNDGCVSSAAAIATVVVNNNPTVSIVASSTNICAGDSVKITASGANTYTWNNGVANGNYFIPATAADYSVTGSDVNGCVGTQTVFIDLRSLPVLTVNANIAPSCANEGITINAYGAETYSFNGSLFSGSVALSPSVTTEYTVVGLGANGCANTLIYTHTIIPCAGDIILNAIVSDVSCRLRNDGSIVLVPQISFTNNVVEYLWSNSLCPTKNCASISSLTAGTYSVRLNITSTVTPTYVRKDSIERSFTILDIQPPCDLKIYNTITINDNGLNDKWIIDNIDLYPNNKITIFNRWGQKVYEVSGYDNKQKSWPTESDKAFLPASTYFYIIDLGDNKPIKGWIEVSKD